MASSTEGKASASVPGVALPSGYSSSPEGPGDRMVPVYGIVVLIFYNVLLSAVLFLVIVEFWPDPPAGSDDGAPSAVDFLGWPVHLGPEPVRFILVTATGALGSIVHVLRSLGWYVGNRELKMSWMARYFLQPFGGGGLALLFYLIVRGGFFSMDAGVAGANPFGFAALGGVVGLFSDQALLKLKKVAEEVFLAVQPGKDAAPQGEERPSGGAGEQGDERDR